MARSSESADLSAASTVTVVLAPVARVGPLMVDSLGAFAVASAPVSILDAGGVGVELLAFCAELALAASVLIG